MALIQWVDEYCRTWGKDMRRIVFKKDGYSSVSSAAMAIDGRFMADKFAAFSQRFPEVFSEEGLLVSRAIGNLPLHEREVLFAHYVIQGMKAAEKAEVMMLPRRTYYDLLNGANIAIASYIDGLATSKDFSYDAA